MNIPGPPAPIWRDWALLKVAAERLAADPHRGPRKLDAVTDVQGILASR